MSEMDRLVQDLSRSPELQQRLLNQPEDLDAAVSAAQAAGYDVSKEEAVRYVDALRHSDEKELSDSQLDAVAGGKKAKDIIKDARGGVKDAGREIRDFFR